MTEERRPGSLIVEQVVTVDGYVADDDGGIGFVETTTQGGGDIADQLAFVSSVDAILFGATTYRMFVDYWPNPDPAVQEIAEHINRLPKFVLSGSLSEAPWGEGTIEILRGPAEQAVATLRATYPTIVVWGSLTLTDALFAANLVDVLRLRVAPVLIGSGRSLTPAAASSTLVLDRVVRSDGQLGISYRVSPRR